ncbi:MAG: 1-(5-phosphoribosyl)-5-[(5-phosphoribosylamino)methylideneamino]imidazole-4-carboxamide isomerase [Defluviitaleaceae bacterium]|nr:1-(5-phosphoribosyl)-5-[(5-phosphoribosylamino)methylideneamino]imidazole-4-carboxamide isomerase [Defluviitaleaceae bacterium]
MRIYPAIDIWGGKCVRLAPQGKFDETAMYGGEPPELAKKWQGLGASWIHCVDLDGARGGGNQNLRFISAMMAALTIPLQLGGGVRTMEDIDRRIEMGVSRVILGTAAVKDSSLLSRAIRKYGPEKIAVGIDALNGIVKISGWEENGNVNAADFCMEMKEIGVGTVIYTDIAKDGAMSGPNFKETQALIDKTGLEIIASGGVSSLDDLWKLKEIGADGAIIGKALYTGVIDLKEAIELYERPEL